MGKPNTPETFWARVDIGEPDECWPWTGYKIFYGYGGVSYEGYKTGAHRVAFYLTHGYYPDPCCLHSCHNPPCCNPAHLREGTQQENIVDRDEAGHHRYEAKPGEANGRAKLTADDVREVRRRYAAGGVSQRELGDEYGVHVTTVSHIILRRLWKHID